MNRRTFISSVGSLGSLAILSGCVGGINAKNPIESANISREQVNVEPLLDSTYSNDGKKENVLKVDVTLNEPALVYLQQPNSQSEFEYESAFSDDGWYQIAELGYQGEQNYPKRFSLDPRFPLNGTNDYIFPERAGGFSGKDVIGFQYGDRLRLGYIDDDGEFIIVKEFTY